MARQTRIEISLPAIVHNAKQVRQFAPKSSILAMIKSNAYGHGIIPVSQTLSPIVDGFGVACIEEAMMLRDQGIQNRILLMAGFLDESELPIIFEQQLDMVIHTWLQVKILRNFRPKNKINNQPARCQIWLKVETGMNRLGLSEPLLQEADILLKHCEHLVQPLHVMTHFSDADRLTYAKTAEQLTRFEQIVQPFPGSRSLANSAGILGWSNAHADWVRPGIMLYGISPFADKIGLDFQLKPAMRFIAKIIAIKDVLAGSTVGYGEMWTCPEDSRIGIISVGYGDGYPRQANNHTPVWCQDKIVSTLGRVSMDMMAIDLSQCPNAKVWDEVVLWGEKCPIERVATKASTSAYELICNITQRVEKRYVE